MWHWRWQSRDWGEQVDPVSVHSGHMVVTNREVSNTGGDTSTCTWFQNIYIFEMIDRCPNKKDQWRLYVGLKTQTQIQKIKTRKAVPCMTDCRQSRQLHHLLSGEKVAFSGSKAAEVIVTKAALFLSSLANALKIVLFQLQSALLSISFRTSKAEKNSHTNNMFVQYSFCSQLLIFT